MKKRFLIVGDNHLDSQTPPNRLDNYMESCLMELQETLKIAKAVKTDYYILLGDVFNRIEVGGVCRNRALEILTSNDGEPWPFQKYITIGNHDIAHNPSYLKKSALQTLLSAGVVEYVDCIEEANVRFLHFTPDLDERLRKGELMNYHDKIYFCHASIVDKPSRFAHVLVTDLIYRDDTRIICSGHIHSPMQCEIEGGYFFNPGSIGRTKIDERHSPQVLLIEFDYETDQFDYKYFKLKNSLSYDIVFDLDGNKQRKIDNKNTEMFIKSVTNNSIGNSAVSSDIETDFRTFAKSKNVKDNDVIKSVIDTINIIKTGGSI